MGFVVGFFGVAALLLGVLFFAGAAMPSFGGRSDPTSPMVTGAVLFVAGICLCFYAGSWL